MSTYTRLLALSMAENALRMVAMLNGKDFADAIAELRSIAAEIEADDEPTPTMDNVTSMEAQREAFAKRQSRRGLD